MLAKWPVAVRIAACIALFFSGAVSLAGGLDGRHGYKLASRSELASTAAALAKVSPGDRIATEPDYNSPVILLGYPVLCGYEGHLWSHGLNYHKQWDALQIVLKHEPGWKEAMQTLDAQWLYVRTPQPMLIGLPGNKK
jgi:hypothetical protein